MKRKPYKNKTTDNNAPVTFSKRYENDLNEASKYLKEHYGSDVIKQQKLSYPFFPRRIRAYSHYTKYICAVAKDRLQTLDIEKELSFIGSLPFMTNLDLLNGFFNISLAIAIFILDALKDCGNLSEAIIYIPSDRNALLAVTLPDNFHYPTFSNDLIRGVILLIEGGNQNECIETNNQDVFYSERNSNRNSIIARSRINSEKTTPTIVQSMKYEQRLQCLVSYIPQAVITKAVRNWKEAIDYCTVLLLKEFEFIERKEYEQGEETKPLSEEQKIALKANVAFDFIDRNRCCALNALKSKKSRLKIDNPYEVCFAAFYSLKCKDDDYAWLIELCGIVGEMACEMLPWYRCPDFSSQPEILYSVSTVHTLNAVYYHSWHGAIDEETDSSLSRDLLCRIVYRKEGYVLPQNNALLRKFMFMQRGMFELIIELSIYVFTTPIFVLILLELYKHKDAPIPIALAIIILILVARRKDLHNLNVAFLKRIFRKFLIRRITHPPEIGFPKSIEDIRSKEEYEKEIDELRQSIAEQKDELSRNKSQLHDAMRTIEEQKIELDAIKAKYDSDSVELAELRETIYNIQNSVDLEVDVNNTEHHFPYSPKKKILIVGGFEKWIVAMKQRIPNAIYINPSSLNFDVALIKNADVLWLQTNAMPHSLYYKIIDRARSKNIRIKYFSFPSAQKCAVQIYMDETGV